MDRAGYVRLDADYLLHVRPHLTDREARVYEVLVLLCDGWERPTTAADIASITKLHVDHVRKALRTLESLKLIACVWQGARTNPNGRRFVTILRDYEPVTAALRALGRIGPDLDGAWGRNSPVSGAEEPDALGRNSPEQAAALGQNGPKTLGRNSPKTLGQNGPKHLTRSDPDHSIPPSQPSPPAVAAPDGPPEPEGGREAVETTPEVPDELVALCRELWTSGEVPLRAARRFVGRLLHVGEPVASTGEIGRYLRSVAKTHRVKTAGCPIAVACVPEEFASWLESARKVVRVQPVQPTPELVRITPQEMGLRATAIIEHLGKCGTNAPAIVEPRTLPTTDVREAASNVRA
jgi:predicted transcriptional regulator